MTRRRTALLAAALSAALACSDDGDPAAAVRRYAETVGAAYRESDPSRLGEVATPDEAQRVTAVVERKRDRGVVLDARLVDLRVLATSAPERDRVTVRALERWRQWDRPLRPGAMAGREAVVELDAEYLLLREPGGWKVARKWIPAVRHLDPVTGRPTQAPADGDAAPARAGDGAGAPRSAREETRHEGGPAVEAW